MQGIALGYIAWIVVALTIVPLQQVDALAWTPPRPELPGSFTHGARRSKRSTCRPPRQPGVLCGSAGTHDVVDASVVIAARRVNALVITSDPDDLRQLDPAMDTHRA